MADYSTDIGAREDLGKHEGKWVGWDDAAVMRVGTCLPRQQRDVTNVGYVLNRTLLLPWGIVFNKQCGNQVGEWMGDLAKNGNWGDRLCEKIYEVVRERAGGYKNIEVIC